MRNSIGERSCSHQQKRAKSELVFHIASNAAENTIRSMSTPPPTHTTTYANHHLRTPPPRQATFTSRTPYLTHVNDHTRQHPRSWMSNEPEGGARGCRRAIGKIWKCSVGSWKLKNAPAMEKKRHEQKGEKHEMVVSLAALTSLVID